MFQEFQRKHQLPTFAASSTVTVDNRKSRLRLPIRLRAYCLLCPSTSCNRDICIRESLSLERQHTPSQSGSNPLNISVRGTDMEEEERVDDEPGSPIRCASTKPKLLLACRADIVALKSLPKL